MVRAGGVDAPYTGAAGERTEGAKLLDEKCLLKRGQRLGLPHCEARG